jgi:hypothetical protein
MHLLCQFGRLHLGLDDLQSDCAAAEMVVPQQLRAMADGEAALAQLRSGLILQALGIAHYLRRRLGVDGWGRHGWWMVAVRERWCWSSSDQCLNIALGCGFRSNRLGRGSTPALLSASVQARSLDARSQLFVQSCLRSSDTRWD